MATLKQRLCKRNNKGTYDTVHLETSADVVLMSNGATVESAINSKLATTGTAASATKLATARTIRTNLAATTAASFNGTANITPGVQGVLPVANGGTGVSNLTELAASLGFIQWCKVAEINQTVSSDTKMTYVGFKFIDNISDLTVFDPYDILYIKLAFNNVKLNNTSTKVISAGMGVSVTIPTTAYGCFSGINHEIALKASATTVVNGIYGGFLLSCGYNTNRINSTPILSRVYTGPTGVFNTEILYSTMWNKAYDRSASADASSSVTIQSGSQFIYTIYGAQLVR